MGSTMSRSANGLRLMLAMSVPPENDFKLPPNYGRWSTIVKEMQTGREDISSPHLPVQYPI
jgi:hypothetical protein